MEIRKATFDDLSELQRVFSCAREYMKSQGNYTQWKDNRPPLFLIERDLNNNCTYVIQKEGKIVGTFSFLIGEEITYRKIYNGKWLNNEPYGTIHRIASDMTDKGIFDFAIEFILRNFDVDIRIDTHRKNKTMLHLLEKYNLLDLISFVSSIETPSAAKAFFSPKFDITVITTLLSLSLPSFFKYKALR